jgi:hypothetical protein
MKFKKKYWKSVLVFLILSMPVSIGYCQKAFIGVEGGINSTNVLSDIPNPYGLLPTGYINSLSGGITFEYKTNNWFALKTGLLYDQRGFIYYPIGYPSSASNAVINYYYLTLPLGVVFRTTHRFYVFVGLGLDPSLCIDAIAQWPIGNSPVPVRDASVSKFDLGEFIEPGIGFQLTKRLNVQASFKARHSYTSVTNVNYNPEYIIQSYGFYYQIGISYGLGKMKE